jgi:hypothetical protein
MVDDDILLEAINKAKAGEKAAAGKMLSDYVRKNPSSETAWIWLSICVAPLDQKKYCLNKVLAINPENEGARKALSQLDVPVPSFSYSSNFDASQNIQAPIANNPIPSVPIENVGGYIQSVLLPNERVLSVAKIHWVIFLLPAIFTLIAVALTLIFFLISANSSSIGENGTGSALLLSSSCCCIPFWAIGLITGVIGFLRYSTTEFALTDKRVIGKHGILRRNSLELVLGKIESIRVNQGITGRMLDYGTIVITGSGGTHQYIPYIASPMELKRKINMTLQN